ncbi:Cloroperoxidase [Marasmius fiardii PR-910]|nr:Cloroperoxidase [Marasmius fiardii PR-910]
MKNLLSLIFIAVAVTASTDSQVDWSSHRWQAPGPSDTRGPCPGLNTLANHGFLPRNGRNISIPMILQAGHEGYHIEPSILTIAAKVGLLTSPSDQPTTFSLEDIKAHGVIEHDASLSRQDIALGDNVHFNETIFSTLVNSNPRSDVYNTTSAGQVLQARLADSLKNNPNVTNTDLTDVIRGAESAFYLSVMGDPIQGVAPKKFVQIFFREERLPIEEGWKRTNISITLNVVGALVDKTFEADPAWEPTGNNCPGIQLPDV